MNPWGQSDRVMARVLGLTFLAILAYAAFVAFKVYRAFTMKTRGESIVVMQPLLQEDEGGSTPTSPLQMRVEPIGYKTAKALNGKWHSRLPRIGDPPGVEKAMPCFAATFEGRIFAVAIWSHPVSRNLPQVHWLELRRMAICDERPDNTASWMLGIMARLLKKQRPHLAKLISYQDLGCHSGTIYKAAGWVATEIKKWKPWNNATRKRPQCQSTSDKQRWERDL
jgi:hypothetical protein